MKWAAGDGKRIHLEDSYYIFYFPHCLRPPSSLTAGSHSFQSFTPRSEPKASAGGEGSEGARLERAPSLPSSLHSSIVKGAVPLATGTDDEWEWRGSLPSRSLPARSTFPRESDASWMEGLGVSVASPFHRHSLSTPLATLTAVTRVTKERRKHDGVREEPSKPWAGENGTVKETTIPYLSHPHHMVTARDERNEQGPHVMGSGLMFPVPYAPGLTSGSTGFYG